MMAVVWAAKPKICTIWLLKEEGPPPTPALAATMTFLAEVEGCHCHD